jgi:hypothetical protein
VRLEVHLDAGDDIDEAERHVRAIWPVTVETDWQVPGGLEAMLRRWADRCGGDASGIDALRETL